MATDDVSVKVSADTADFEGGIKTTVSGVDTLAASSARLTSALDSTNSASHDVDALFKQITGSAKTMGAAAQALNQNFREGIVPVSDLNILSERLQSHFAGLAASAKDAGTSIKQIGASSESLAAVNDNAVRAGAAMGHVGGMTVGAKREIMVLAHEAMTGNFSRIPGSLMVLAERFGTVGMAAMRVVVPLATVGFVAYEIASHAEAATQALAKTESALTMSGQAGLFTRDGLQATVSQLALMHGISTQAAQGIVAEFAHIRSVTPQIMADLARGMEGWILKTGEEGPAAAHKWSTAMADPEKALEDLDRQTGNVSAGTKQLVADLMDAGDVMGAKAVVAREFGDEMERIAEQIKTPFQRAAQEAGIALSSLADAFEGSSEQGDHLAAVMRQLAEAIRACEVPVTILGKALRDLMDMVTMVVQAAMAGFASMKTVAEVAATAVFEFSRMVKQAMTGDLAEAQKTALDMPRKLAEEWGIRAAEVKGHLDEIRAAMKGISEPYLPGHKSEKTPEPHGAAKTGGGENGNDRDKRVLDILDRTLTVQRELRQIEGEKMLLTEQLAAFEGQLETAPDAQKGKLKSQIADIKEAIKLENERAANLRKKDGGESQMEGYRRELAEIQAADKRSLEERKAEDLKFWQEKKSHLVEGNKDFAQVTLEIRRLEKAIDADKHAETLASLERDRAAAAKGSERRIAIAKAEADEIKRYAGEHSKAYQDALTRINEMEKEHQKELRRIEAEGIDARAAAKKEDLETDAENLRFLRDMGALGDKDALARLRDVKAEEYQIERDALTAKLGLKGLEVAERDRINKQIAQLDQGYRLADLAATHQQTLAELHEWQSAASSIGGAFSGAFKGMALQGQSFQQAERSVAVNVAGVWLDLAAKKVGTWIWSEGVMKAWSHVTGQREVVEAATRETSKTGAVIAGQTARTASSLGGAAARNAAEATEHSSFLARVAEQVAQWLGLETAKTAETVTESTARSTTASASALAAIMAAKAEAAGEIPAYAAIAAVAAMASVAAIPFVGWAMAPGVAAETFADGMMYLPMASAAGGWDRVPYDGALTELHKDEMVLPSSISNPLRDMISAGYGGGVSQSATAVAAGPMLGLPRLKDPANFNASAASAGGGGDGGRDRQSGGDTYHVTINAMDAASFANTVQRQSNSRALISTIRSQVKAGAQLSGKR